MRASIFACVGLLLLVPRAARAADWYVDAAAAAGGNGSQGSPFQTINAALTGLSRGDTVWLATGTYPEIVEHRQAPRDGHDDLPRAPRRHPGHRRHERLGGRGVRACRLRCRT